MKQLLLILLLSCIGVSAQPRFVLSRSGFQSGGGVSRNAGFQIQSHLAVPDLGRMKSLRYSTGPSTLVEKLDASIPNHFALRQNYPNPYNQSTRIQFDIPRPVRLQVQVYSSVGQRVAQLVDAEYGVGRYQLYYRGIDDAGRLCASGVYFIRFYADGWSKTIKTAILR